MFKRAHHPKSFLTLIRNYTRGLVARTRILLVLEKGVTTAKAIAQKTGLTYRTVLYHLHLLESEKILTASKKKPYIWEVTGAGQQRLADLCDA